MRVQAEAPSVWRSLGPGVLFAGAAIGTSHLVQSTRAGALFGLGFLGVIVFANVIKYPAFRFGPAYTAATGASLITGYAGLGRWVVVLVALVLLPVQAIIVAATAITTAGIATTIIDTNIQTTGLAIAFIALAVLIVRAGGYNVLSALSKLFVATLTLCTLAATVLVLPHITWQFTLEPFHSVDPAVFIFAVAVMGFMPSAIDLSILHSLWAVENNARRPTRSLLDFNIGYIGTAVLAVGFLFMGAGVMHATGETPADSAAAFAGQVIALYTQSLGAWSGIVVSVSALAVMFTTLLAIVDGAPRLQAACLAELREETPGGPGLPWLTGLTVLIAVLSTGVLLFLMSSFTRFIDFVTTTSFLIGPLIAVLNHLVITSKDVPLPLRPSPLMLVWSWTGIAAMSLVALAFLYIQFGR